LVIDVAGILMAEGIASSMKESIDSYPSLDSMNAVSVSSGPICLSAKVSRAANGDDEEALKEAKVRQRTGR
jgi:hypothetical protein